MKQKKHFIAYINEVDKLLAPINLANNLHEIRENITNSELVVPVVGGFSAGKSSLINSFLGQKDLLPTKVTPETALAAELRYNETDYIEAISDKDVTTRYEISELTYLRDNAKSFKFLRLYLNNPKLKEISPLVLVDMPGFDSPIENHNKAILAYLSRGIYFVFLTSVEDGAITRSMSSEIQNLQQIGKGFSFCISKTNLRPESDVIKVKENIAQQLDDDFDYTEPLILLDDNGGENLQKILTSINPDELINLLFLEPLQEQSFALIEGINTQISTFKSTKEQAQQAIEALNESLREVEKTKQRAIADIEHRYSNNSVEHIISAVNNALYGRHNLFVGYIESNQQYKFSQEVNDLVKNTLLYEVKNTVDNMSQEIIKDFTMDLDAVVQRLSDSTGFNANEFNIGSESIRKIADNTQSFLLRAQSGLEVMAEKGNKNNTTTTVYRAIATVLGITTSVVAPVVEIALIFLPEIINFFTQKKREEAIKENIERKLTGEVYPHIAAEIRRSLPAAQLKEQVQLLIEQISQNFEEQLKQKQANIDIAAQEKQKLAEEASAQIAALEQAKQSITKLSQQYLFTA